MAKKAKPPEGSEEAVPAEPVVVPFPERRPKRLTRVDIQVFKFRLRNGFTGQTILRGDEVDRVWHAVQEPDSFHNFIVFDGDNRRMALNLRQLVASQFDIVGEDGLVAKDVDGGGLVEIYFADSKKALRLDVEEDAVTIEEFDDAGADDDDLCQVANFFFGLEHSHDGSDYADRLRISDGSIIWFRLHDIAFASIPLTLFAKPGSEAAMILKEADEPS
jgi:hypothetical protein